MKNLLGSSPSYEFKCYTGKGEKAELNQAIVPVIKQDLKLRKFKYIGTAFFISITGLLITAKHVLQDVFDEQGKASGPIGICQFLPENEFILRSFIRGFYYENSDVAIAQLDQPRHKETNEVLKNKILCLSFAKCNVGDDIYTYAYPTSKILSSGKKHEMIFTPYYFAGQLVKNYEKERGSALLKNPCWQTNMYIHSGASGGPVFNKDGMVIGINSVSDSDLSFSFISTLYHVMNLKIKKLAIKDHKKRDFTLKELGKIGIVNIKW